MQSQRDGGLVSEKPIAAWVCDSAFHERHCSLMLRDAGWILSSYFVEKAFSEDAKDFGDQIIMDIKQEFIHKLKQSDWMTKDTREVAIGKGALFNSWCVRD